MRCDSVTSTIIYSKVTAKIEQFSKLAYFILMKVASTAIMVPAIVTTYFKYYVLQLSDASFQHLPFTYGTSSVFFQCLILFLDLLSRKTNYNPFLHVHFLLFFKVAIRCKNTAWLFVSIDFWIHGMFFNACYHSFWN